MVRTKKSRSQSKSSDSEPEIFEVEMIVGVKETTDGTLFCVKWKGYPMSDNTWEPVENLNCPELLGKFIEDMTK